MMLTGRGRKRPKKSDRMIKKILVPVDGSTHALKTLDFASDLAQKYRASLLILHVVAQRTIPEGVRRFVEVEHISEPPDWVYEQTLSKNIARESEQRAKKKGVSSVRAIILEGDAAEVILSVAKTEDADAIVMGSKGVTDLRGLLMGSVAHKVVQLAHCTVITIK